jgi:glyoxylase-like metal-dependent hydrolase (beta-lactamase superfamily II)
MRAHHLNCGTMCPHCERFYQGRIDGRPGGLEAWMRPARFVAHCLLLETNDGLVLVDTGLGTADLANPKRLGGVFNVALRPRLSPDETALAQVRAKGFSPADVRHIVVTHLDLDHAGGLADFPHAQVHVFHREHDAATAPTWRERMRYLGAQWAHGPRWVRHEVDGERWHGFERVRAIPGLGDDVLMIPLHGHTRGHCGVAVKGDDGWLLHAGDAYFFHGEMEPERPCPAGLRMFQTIVEMRRGERLRNQQRLRELANGSSDVRVFCAHDPVEFERFA